jgi:hypothetical protein
MKTDLHALRAALAVGAFLAAPLAGAVGRLADIAIIDRTSGAALETHYWRGEYWVAGAPGSRYSISIRNASGARLLAVTSVDGINVISGETAGVQQTGYVFAPFQGYEITGWRKSDRDVAAFEFTAAPNSYAERTGRPANVGVIGIALFRERINEPAIASDAPAAPAASARSEAADANAASHGRLAASPEAKLGTGHGAREASPVTHTDFERQSATPNEVIRIRYDSYANLVAMGVIRAPVPHPVRPDPFPDSSSRYVPDPPGYPGPGLR